MIYAYIRVSSDKQSVENQRFEINNYCKSKGIAIDFWVDEVVSGTKKIKERKLGKLIKKLNQNDILILSEISRLGRSILMIMSILNRCMEQGVKIYAIKERYELGDNINSKILAFAFGLTAEIERTLISQRTKEALAKRRADGVILGRPKGRKSSPKVHPLYNKEDEISKLFAKGLSQTKVAKRLHVHRDTLRKFIHSNMNQDNCFKTS